MKGKFSYPGALHDRLYTAGYDHVKPGSTTCAECDESQVIEREDRCDTDPHFHYGVIASGNQVIKDGKTRERLSQEYGALCFEMEAAGLYNFPCLVIRGICDYADSHKNKMWQEYAPEIVEAFEPLLQNKIVHTLELHREFSEDTALDIRSFLEARFTDIKYKRRVQKDPWPPIDELHRLVQLSTTPETLFIYAATLCRFVSDKNRGPIQQLITWLEQGSKSQLHQIYSPILEQAFSGFEEGEFCQKLRFLGTIVLLARPLSAKSLTLLLRMDLDDFSWWVPRLYAVLHVPSELYQPIHLLHKSFSDFLASDDGLGSNRYKINTAEIHTRLAEACIQYMTTKLRQDICGVQKPGITNDEIDTNSIRSCIPSELEYACNYWFLHLKRSGQSLSSFTYTFLYDHLLHWIEVLSLLGRLADGVSILRELLEMSQACNDLRQDFAPFVQDSIRVIVAFITIIELAPLQIYGSSIFFSLTGSIVRQRFWHQRIPKTASHEHLWDATKAQDHLVSNGASQCITKIALSPDGQLVGSASRDNTIRIWDVSTLLPRWKSVCDAEGILELCFSSDSKLLASLSEDRQLYIWGVISAAPSEAPQGSASISDVAYSPDNQTAATTDWPEFGGEVALRETVTGRVTCSIGLRYNGDWIAQGSENLLWVPPQYRPTDGSFKGWVSRDPATIFIGSASSHVIGFRIV
nr:hypothetical protein FVER53263_20545 [Fusarium verticillioides]